MGKLLKQLTIFLLLLLVVFFSIGNTVFSGNDDRTINLETGIRLSHPSVVIGNHHYSVNNPFNYSEDRLIMYETRSDSAYPPGQNVGRGFVWGYISELRNGFSSFSDYQSKTPIVPKYDGRSWDGYSILWSPFPDENNIIYGLAYSLKSIIKMNVDTGVGEELISNYDIDNSIDYADYVDPFTVGWTTDKHLVVGSDYGSAWRACFEFDVKSKAIKYYSSYPGFGNEKVQRFPTNGHGHGGKNKSRTHIAKDYGQTQDNNVQDLTTGAIYEDCSWEKNAIQPTFSDGKGPYTNHASWYGSDDWMVVSASRNYPRPSSPAIIDYYFYQVYPIYESTEPCNSGGNVFEYRLILTISSSRSWCSTETCEGSDYVYHYSDAPHCVVAPSGNKMYCSYTDNKYSYRDYLVGGDNYSDFGLPGGWVYDLNLETGGIIKPDLFQDQAIDINDFNLFKSYFKTQNPDADFNNDIKTNTQDLGIMMSVWGDY